MRVFVSSQILVPLILTITAKLVQSQYFDPKMDDQIYLNSIQNVVIQEVKETKGDLMDQAKIIQQVTRNYIAARLKHNLFTALRVLAEKELAIDAMTMQDRPRQPRQDEETAAASGADEDEEPNTTRKPSNILPQVANLIKAVFGGNINLTSYVESAATYLPKPIGNQLVGVVKLLANNPGSKYTSTASTPTTVTTTTPNTTQVLIQVRASLAPAPANPPSDQGPTRPPFPPTVARPDVDEDEDETVAKARQIPGLDILGSIGGNVAQILNAGTALANFGNTVGNSINPETIDKVGNALGTILHPNNIADTIGGVLQPGGLASGLANAGNNLGKIFGAVNKDTEKNLVTSKPKTNDKNPQNTTANASGFEEEETSTTARSMENKMNGIDVGNLAKEVRNGLGDLIKVMPDLFRGAHEAYKLLNSVTSLFQRLESEAK